jgi:hypothetical protein
MSTISSVSINSGVAAISGVVGMSGKAVISGTAVSHFPVWPIRQDHGSPEWVR